MLALLNWLKLIPSREGRSCWKEVLKSALEGGCEAEHALEPMLDYLGSIA